MRQPNVRTKRIFANYLNETKIFLYYTNDVFKFNYNSF